MIKTKIIKAISIRNLENEINKFYSQEEINKENFVDIKTDTIIYERSLNGTKGPDYLAYITYDK